MLVNNAGATWGEPMDSFPESAWDKVLDLNLKAPFFLTRAFLPLLEEAATDDDPARVVNVGSIDGLHVPPMHTYSYSSSKAALHHLTRVLAKELARRQITVNAIAPGVIQTAMIGEIKPDVMAEYMKAIPVGRVGKPEDIANAVIFLASEQASWISGQILSVDGGRA